MMTEMTPIRVEERIAACAAHEVNRAYCHFLGDASQAHWEDAPDWQRESALAGVLAIVANPDLTPADSHAGWLARKVAEGWVYGEVKDADKKTHPCIMPYDELPEAQRRKDHIFGVIVRLMLEVAQ